MTAVRIRPATGEDAEALFELHRSTVLVAYRHIFPADRYAFPDDTIRCEWQALLSDARAQVVIAEMNDGPVGTVTVVPPQLDRLFVVPSRWDNGVGTALYEWAVAALRRAATRRAELVVLEGNERARVFYERRGWHTEGPPMQSPYPPFPAALRYVLDLPAG